MPKRVTPQPPPSDPALPNIQYMNSTFLMYLHMLATNNPAEAAFEFDLSMEEINELARLDLEDIQRIVAHIDISFFRPRMELLSLRNLPPPLAGVFAAVRCSSGPRSQLRQNR